jgi:hypothetical protein
VPELLGDVDGVVASCGADVRIRAPERARRHLARVCRRSSSQELPAPSFPEFAPKPSRARLL